MSLTYNNSTVNAVTYNGQTVNKINYNGTEIWSAEEDLGPLCFTANTAGSTITLNKIGSPAVNFIYVGYWDPNSIIVGGSIVWQEYTAGTAITLTNAGDKVYFGAQQGGNYSFSDHLQFSMTGSIAASGDINSLIDFATYAQTHNVMLYEFACYKLFFYCRGLTSAPALPATTIKKDGYSCMFYACSGLLSVPMLPATSLAVYCYSEMFSRCTSITSLPQGMLPATTLAECCYHCMFYSCTSLTSIPELPAVSFATGCYYYMFGGCTKIKMSLTYDATDYPNAYTFGATPSAWNTQDMFYNTGGSFTGTPTVQTLYTSNTIIS